MQPAAAMNSGSGGADSRVETISRLAQWRIDTFGPGSYRRSDPFKLGIWNWLVSSCLVSIPQIPNPSIDEERKIHRQTSRYLSVEKNRCILVRLFPEPGRVAKEQPPFARFLLRLSWPGPPRRSCVSPVLEHLLRTSDDFVWQVDGMHHGRFTVDVEFLDLRVATNNASTWPCVFVYHS
ncbi:hypothetical protein U9M48_041332 [Paspalum notatum var. saurae]|uniref:Uncharacterized protein n=1 Tax=Paspalum notatum var. saurae TaxID=547442 RepID=A0AAQ3XF61_PASNO